MVSTCGENCRSNAIFIFSPSSYCMPHKVHNIRRSTNKSCSTNYHSSKEMKIKCWLTYSFTRTRLQTAFLLPQTSRSVHAQFHSPVLLVWDSGLEPKIIVSLSGYMFPPNHLPLQARFETRDQRSEGKGDLVVTLKRKFHLHNGNLK